jgi:hypothetical protein
MLRANDMIVKVQYMSNFRKGHGKADKKIKRKHTVLRYSHFASLGNRKVIAFRYVPKSVWGLAPWATDALFYFCSILLII